MKNNVFFGPEGLTATSANHVANLAKEYIQTLQGALQVSFYDTKLATLDGNEETVQYGVKSVKEYESTLDKIAKANSLIAWLREGIKAKESLTKALNAMDIEDWAKETGNVLPERPEKEPAKTVEDFIDDLSIKQRNRYFAIQAAAATVGKYIHGDGAFTLARERLQKRIVSPLEVKENGRDTLIYKYVPSISTEEVEDTFFALQKKHRELQAELNGINARLEEQARQSQQETLEKYGLERQKYANEMEAYQTMFGLYRTQRGKEIAALKIVLPDDLKEIYAEVNSLGK